MQRIAGWNSVRDVWETEAVSLLSGRSDVFSETFMTSGSMRNGVAYELPTSAHHTDGSASLCSQLGGKLLPTATSADSNGSGGSNASNVTLTDAVVRTDLGKQENTRLLPTPRSNEANGVGEHGAGGADLRTTIDRLLPTPNTMEHLPARTGEARERQLRRGEGPEASRRQTMGNLREDIVEIEPGEWGPYAAAISRWEAVLGRPAPAPTEEGPKGGRRLSSLLVEWMMGLPEGWVTGHGLPRTAELKMLGNGVVPQQAIAALRSMVS